MWKVSKRVFQNNLFYWHGQLHEWGDIHCARLQGQVGMMDLRVVKFYVY